jgi:hypothetical protein
MAEDLTLGCVGNNPLNLKEISNKIKDIGFHRNLFKKKHFAKHFQLVVLYDFGRYSNKLFCVFSIALKNYHIAISDSHLPTMMIFCKKLQPDLCSILRMSGTPWTWASSPW